MCRVGDVHAAVGPADRAADLQSGAGGRPAVAIEPIGTGRLGRPGDGLHFAIDVEPHQAVAAVGYQQVAVTGETQSRSR